MARLDYQLQNIVCLVKMDGTYIRFCLQPFKHEVKQTGLVFTLE